ncbi:MFS transporter [Vibrio lamellibrachiae]|uniref:MFS transporter n=1 Tax=Vibrio lamellibrachiae TaxID=2910253 RepID=UPI003D0D3BB9
MSLVSVPFVGTTADTVIHVVSGLVLIATIGAVLFGFWKFHELPISEAHSKKHQQIGLITALTWIGFLWHWVWVVAVIVAFVDAEKAIISVRDTWRSAPPLNQSNEES